MKAIFKRELSAYFRSAIGYVFLTVFYLIAGFVFIIGNLASSYSDLQSVFSFLMVVLVLLVPVLSMRLLSEEQKQKTDQALLTAPVSLTGIVLGKFFAAFAIYGIGLAVTALYALVMSFFGTVQWLVFLGQFLGMLLLGAAFIAISIFVSSLTESQVISAIGSVVLLLFLFLLTLLSNVFTGTNATKVIDFFAVSYRMQNFFDGALNASDVVYFLSLTFVFLFLSVRKLDSRRWS